MNTKLISIVVGLILVVSTGSLVYLNKKQANNATMYESASSSSAVATSTAVVNSDDDVKVQVQVKATTTTSVTSGITLAQVATHNSRSNCWSAINGSVYDLTSWIPNHPGGEGAITGLCGIDGSIRYNSQHGGKSKPAMALAGFKVGVLANNMITSRQKIGITLLRFGLAGVFLWFGFSQLIDSLKWVAIVPEWAVNLLHLPPAMIVMANGIFEVIFGSLLAMGFFVRTASVVLGLHLAVIAYDLGFTPVGVRDTGLALSVIALSLIYTKQEDKSLV